MARLKDKICIVTGAADGIGFAIASAMVSEGATVWLSDIDDTKGAAAAASLAGQSGSAHFHHCDVAEASDITALVDAVMAEHGRVDVLVNNAAIAIGGMPLHEMEDTQWERLIAVNLTSVFRCCKAVLPHMIAQNSGAIINMSSAQGHIGLDGWTAYAGAKGAVMSMTRQMAVEFGPAGIRVNSISPGTIDTPMNVKVVADLGEHLSKTWVKMHPIGRIGKPEEVAEAAVYLASDLAGFTTGVDLKVDGGLTATPRYVPEFFKPDTP